MGIIISRQGLCSSETVEWSFAGLQKQHAELFINKFSPKIYLSAKFVLCAEKQNNKLMPKINHKWMEVDQKTSIAKLWGFLDWNGLEIFLGLLPDHKLFTRFNIDSWKV